MSLVKHLLEEFIVELAEGPTDSESPINGSQSENQPDPTQTGKDGKRELKIGDPVIITGKVQFNGTAGDVDDFGQDGSFIVVNLYNHGKHSFHASDVDYNDYADSEEEEDDDNASREIRNLRRLSGYN